MDGPTRTTLALTTVYTPPASCTDVITESRLLFWQGGIQQTGDVDCFPPQFTGIFDSYYSPGICPHGWTGAAIDKENQNPTAAQEFNSLCCPSGYDVTSNLPVDGPTKGVRFCASPMPATMTNVYSTSTLAEGPIPEHPTLQTVIVATPSAAFIWADLIQVRWQSTDTQIVSLWSSVKEAATASSAMTTTAASTAGKATVSHGVATSTAPKGGSSHSLSGGAIAGIVVGSLAAVGILIGAVVFFCLRRRRRGTAVASRSDNGRQVVTEPKYTGQGRQELHNDYTPAELNGAAGQQQAYELAASSR